MNTAPQPQFADDNLTPEQEAALLESIARGKAQFQAGEGIAGDAVFAWIKSWGTKQELPAPKRKTPRA